jgi:Reverse transcriptase (RNA-dependent DNA polymerase)
MSGVRQGEVLSTTLFSLHIDVIINALKKSGLCCHIGHCYVGCLFYADYILLISASLIKLQNMMFICFRNGEALDTAFNAKKSSLFVTGKGFDVINEDMRIGHDFESWSCDLKYLGVVFSSARSITGKRD